MEGEKKSLSPEQKKQVKDELENRKYEGDAILTIINKLDLGEWTDFFPNISARKAELYYAYGVRGGGKEMIENSIEDILAHTYFHLNIDESFIHIVQPLMSHEDDQCINSEENIRVYGSLTTNIPKKVFVNGIKFEAFIDYLKKMFGGAK